MLESAAYALNVVLPIAFGVTAAVYLVNFVRNRRGPSALARAALAASIFTALAMAVIRGIGEQHMPLSNAAESLSFFALATTVVYAYLESRTGTQAMGIFVVGTAFLFQLAASFQYQPFAPAPEILYSAWFGVHASTSILSFSGFAISAVMSALYLLLYRELHAGRPGYIFRRIPSLEALDDMAFRGVAVGFVMYAIGMISGSIWAHQAWGKFWSWDPKQCSTLVVGLLYGAYLWARTRQGWSGRRVAYFALFGFVMLLFTFVVVERLFPTEHKFV